MQDEPTMLARVEQVEHVLRRRVSQLTLLSDVGRQIAAVLDLEAVLERAARLVQAGFDYHHVALFILDRERHELVMRARAGDYVAIFPAGHRIPAGSGMVGWVASHGQTLLAGDVSREPRYVDFLGGAVPTRSELAIPLGMGGEVIGVLDIQSPQLDGFDADDVLAMETLAGQIAVAIENARLYERARQEIADRREAEDEIRRLKEFNEGIVHSMAEGIVVEDALGRITFVNPAAAALLGYARADLEGQHWTAVVPDDQRPIVDQAHERRARGQTDRYELELQRKDGTRLPVLVSAGPRTRGDAQVFDGSLAVFTDLSHRVQAERELRQRNRELDLLNRVIAASTANHEVPSILSRVCRELALAFDVPQVVAALLDDEKGRMAVVAAHQAEGREVAIAPTGHSTVGALRDRTGPLAIDSHSPSRDGDGQPQDAILDPIRVQMQARGVASLLLVPLVVDNKVIGSLALEATQPRIFSSSELDLARRVAEQVSTALARARLREVQQRLSTAVEQAADSIVITDTAGTILYVNPAFEQVSGYARAEALGRNPRFLKSGRHDQAFYAAMWSRISAGQVWQGRLINRHRDDSLYTVDMTITPVRGPDGTIVNYVATRRDVTRELELEEQFRQAQKMEALGRLAGGVAHDFGNVLTVIHISTRLMERQLRPEDPLWKHVERIQDAAERAMNLSRQLLSFSRREIVKPRLLNLSAVVGDMTKMLQRILGEDVDLATTLPEDVWPIEIDPSQVDQIVVNLAVNAQDAMPHGGRLAIETANVVLDEAYAAQHLDVQPGEYVLLAMSDTGTGMDEQVQAQIFEPFFTTKERGKGTGLGLSTVFGIVKQYAGHIGVHSELGRGTGFKIYLPRAVAVPEEIPWQEAPAAVRRGTETLLVVEDQPDVCALVQHILTGHGYRVLVAADGVEALRVSEQHEGAIDLLLTDLVMPRLNGLDLVRQVRRQRPEIRVLYMSGYADRPLVQQLMADPSTTVLAKPFTVEALIDEVRSVLEPNWAPDAYGSLGEG